VLDEGIMEQQLVNATWGLVVATSLLVLATLIPLISGILDRREKRMTIAANVIPDLNILKSRLNAQIGTLKNTKDPSDEVIARVHKSYEKDSKVLAPLFDVRELSMKSLNDLYILRHLIAFADDDLHVIMRLLENDTPDREQIRDRWLKIQRSYVAARSSLDAVENALPRKLRNIDGEDFWTRFARVSNERESAAAQAMAIQATERRTSDRSGD
jgi:hypothetical protein